MSAAWPSIPVIFPNQPYDVNRDFIPVTLLARVPNLFVVHPYLPMRNFAEFIAYAKKNPGQLNYGSAGNAGAGHLAMGYPKLVTGMFMVDIPYRGTGPMLTDLLAGRTQATNVGLPALLPHVRSGKLRAIAVGTAQRLPALPDLPTVAVMGFKDFEVLAVVRHPGPRRHAARDRQTAAGRVARIAEVHQRHRALRHSDSAVGGGSPAEDFAADIGQQQPVWKDIVLRAGIKPD